MDGILPFLQRDLTIREGLITVGAPMGKRLNHLLVKPLFHLFLSCVWRQKPTWTADVKLPCPRPGLPGNVISFHIVPLHGAHPGQTIIKRY